MKILQILSSLKLTLPLMVLLWIAILYAYRLSSGSTISVAIPLILLAINLLAALIVNPRFRRQGGLLVFHLCLLALLLLAAVGQLTSLHARLEIAEGQWFDDSQLQILRAGPLHPYKQLNKVGFKQAAVQVNYHPGLIRGHTQSDISMRPSDKEPVRITVGDNVPLRIEGYQFYTSSNKGFALVLTWLGADGSEQSGSVHLPSYPMNDWQLKRHWTTPSGVEVEFQFKLNEAVSIQKPWILTKHTAVGELTAVLDRQAYQLKPGKWLKVKGGNLRFDEVRMWMGYEVYFNPILPWLFVTALFGVCGLAVHYWDRFGPHSQLEEIRNKTADGNYHAST